MPKTKGDTEDKGREGIAKKSTGEARKIGKVQKRKKIFKKPASKEKEEEEEYLWPLGKGRYAKVHEFMGSVYVDIRCYYFKDGDIHPGKAGISLSMEQWEKFMKSVGEINEAAKVMKEDKTESDKET